jgi:hypothetical protein
MNIVDLITKIASQAPEHRQDLIDLATLGYRDGLLAGKVTQITQEEELEPGLLDESDLEEYEVEEVISATEAWFRELMVLEAKAMVKLGGVFPNGVDLRNFKIGQGNRVKIALEDLSKEHPGLFE